MTNDNDDWETDPDFVNDTSEKESRWGARTVEGSGHQGSVSMDQLRKQVLESDAVLKQKQLEEMPKASIGYGGKFGVQTDRIDKSAETWEFKSTVEKHVSQKDYSKGFGGKYGVDSERQDKSAVGWEHHENLAQHASQKDCTKGFGGKYGVESDRQDKSAVGWEYKGQVEAHVSQKDHSKGFGGKYGVQEERKDKSAVGWDYHEKVEPHVSQKDYAKGFGGKFGVEKDRQDKSAEGWEYKGKVEAHESQRDYSKGFGGKYGIETDKKDKSAADWNYKEKVELHESQKDHSKGFGGKFGVQTDRQDKCAEGWGSAPANHNQNGNANGHPERQPKPPPVVEKGHASTLRSRFEQLTTAQVDTDAARQAAQERRRQEDQRQQEEQRRLEEERQQKVAAFNAEREKLASVEGQEEDSDQQTVSEEVSVPKSPAHRRPVGAVPMMITSPVQLAKKDTTAEASSPKQFHSQQQPEEKRVQPEQEEEDIQSNQCQTPAYNQNQSLIKQQPSLEQSPIAFVPLDASSAINDHPLAPPSHPMADTGICAIAVYDYQAGAEDEISFEPDDVITNIEQIDAGWWRGKCHEKYGLFPANYVLLQ